MGTRLSLPPPHLEPGYEANAGLDQGMAPDGVAQPVQVEAELDTGSWLCPVSHAQCKGEH